MNIRFTALAVLFMACLLTANIIAVKLLALPFGIVPAGILVFPVSYAINDIISEIWGFRVMHQVILLGFVGNLVAVVAILLAGVWPAPPFWTMQGSYDAILGFTPRLLLASFSAYLVGQTLNSLVFVRIKNATDGRWLWLRAISSTAVGEAIDTLIFVLIAFTGILPTSALITAMLTQWIIKVGYEIVATPFTYWIVGTFKREQKEVLA
jgi:uncharacterized integral membrane protein (TIGR00697 family)